MSSQIDKLRSSGAQRAASATGRTQRVRHYSSFLSYISVEVSELLDQLEHLVQFPVILVANKVRDVNCVLRLQAERYLGVVYDHRSAQISAELSQVLHKHSLQLNAVLPEEPRMKAAPARLLELLTDCVGIH
mmetsp:Transcript_7686/g.23269  ORF Transcript_7686/g.23269 Transcript_7686/m.23269 type:complete len:132 (+) Transcript_7686:2990-3385(+)